MLTDVWRHRAVAGVSVMRWFVAIVSKGTALIQQIRGNYQSGVLYVDTFSTLMFEDIVSKDSRMRGVIFCGL